MCVCVCCVCDVWLVGVMFMCVVCVMCMGRDGHVFDAYMCVCVCDTLSMCIMWCCARP